jgi:cytochrome c biogenesis protein
MSTLEQAITNTGAPTRRSGEPIISRFIKLLCSVRFGVALLILLGLACLIGMLVMQQSVDGFERYFTDLTPSQRLVYGTLGIFDIYHSWYFNTLLAILSMNIILSSIDRFPKASKFFFKPNLTVPVRWLRSQKQTTSFTATGKDKEIAGRIADAMKETGWRKPVVTEKGGNTFVFAQSGTWNRLGAYAVHVGLLTIFLGGFLTAQMGSTGQMPLAPGKTTNLMSDTVVDLDKVNQITKRLPFEVTCTDIQQKLIKKDESLSAMNTIDWITRISIKDETGTHEGTVQMNRPFDYRGYRFFQASFTNIGRARNITIKATPANGGEPQMLTIPRNGSATLADGTKVDFSEFHSTFRLGQQDQNEETSDYENPAAVLKVSAAGSTPQTAYAFGPQMTNMPVAGKQVAGYTYQLLDFEKVADQHILSVQRDPGATIVYAGFIILFVTLIAVFFFSHQRVWAAIENSGENKFTVTAGGQTNRSHNAFREKFKRFVNQLEAIKS